MEEHGVDHATVPGGDVPIRLQLVPFFACDQVGENIQELMGRRASAFRSDPHLLREVAIEPNRHK